MAIIFLLGITIGSFLNVCIYRIPRKESIAFPSSHCTSCSTPLKWYDLLPIISFLLLRGKCRYCGERISPRYPFVELLNGIIFLLLCYKFEFSIDLIYYAFLFCLFIIVTFVDIDKQIIPNGLVLIILIGSIINIFTKNFVYHRHIDLLNHIGGLLISGLIFLSIFIISKGGIGGGDIKLIGTLGFILGIPHVFLNIFLAFILGGIISIFLLAFGFKKRKDPIPFGPFIILGCIVTILWGERIISWYMLTLLG